MYDAFFHLLERPFAATPQTEHYVPARSIEAARQTLIRCIERAEGTGVLIGPSGAGKTLLCHMLREQLHGAFAPVLLGTTRLDSPRALLQAILFELSLPCRGMDDGELRLTLIDFLNNDAKCGQGIMLLVDEAHTLPLRVLEEVRLITNVSVGGLPRVRLLLAGGPLLEERLASPKLESFSQRTAARCYLEPLDRGETFEYIRAQIACCGGDPAIFAESALQAAYRATDGVPRLINQVCDHALVLACSCGKRQLTEADVEGAWADLQQLPTPWTQTPGETSGADDLIQFGQLEDEFDEMPSSATTSTADVAIPTAHAHVAAPAKIKVPAQEVAPAQATSSAPNVGVRLATGLGISRPRPVEILDEIDQRLRSIEIGSVPRAVTVRRDPGSDPFGEAFDEEEVVVDRFGMSHTAFWDQMPQVYSAEGRLLSSLLAPYVEVARPVQLGVVSTCEDVCVACDDTIEVTADESMIIIEDDPAPAPSVRRPMSGAYRQEYSQLFARLKQSL